ncbi:hypothetical protein [Steroidobacter cummioxidans]|nr:hypothetical protein [Steroidobacter cummioxidans]
MDVINDLSLQISEGKFIVFVGPGRAIVHTSRALARNTLQSQLVPA